MLFNGIFPRNDEFFNMLDQEADSAVLVAQLFKEIVAQGEISGESREKMRDLEHKGDSLAYAIIDKLNKVFVTPFDREDVHELAKRIDDINDMLNGVIRRMKIYRVKKISSVMVEFSVYIEEAVNHVSCAVHSLRDKKKKDEGLKCCNRIRRLESEGDKLRDRALTELFEKEKDAVEVIKWKEIYQDAEHVLDICKKIAHTVETIIVKNA